MIISLVHWWVSEWVRRDGIKMRSKVEDEDERIWWQLTTRNQYCIIRLLFCECDTYWISHSIFASYSCIFYFYFVFLLLEKCRIQERESILMNLEVKNIFRLVVFIFYIGCRASRESAERNFCAFSSLRRRGHHSFGPFLESEGFFCCVSF